MHTAKIGGVIASLGLDIVFFLCTFPQSVVIDFQI